MLAPICETSPRGQDGMPVHEATGAGADPFRIEPGNELVGVGGAGNAPARNFVRRSAGASAGPSAQSSERRTRPWQGSIDSVHGGQHMTWAADVVAADAPLRASGAEQRPAWLNEALRTHNKRYSTRGSNRDSHGGEGSASMPRVSVGGVATALGYPAAAAQPVRVVSRRFTHGAVTASILQALGDSARTPGTRSGAMQADSQLSQRTTSRFAVTGGPRHDAAGPGLPAPVKHTMSGAEQGRTSRPSRALTVSSNRPGRDLAAPFSQMSRDRGTSAPRVNVKVPSEGSNVPPRSTGGAPGGGMRTFSEGSQLPVPARGERPQRRGWLGCFGWFGAGGERGAAQPPEEPGDLHPNSRATSRLRAGGDEAPSGGRGSSTGHPKLEKRGRQPTSKGLPRGRAASTVGSELPVPVDDSVATQVARLLTLFERGEDEACGVKQLLLVDVEEADDPGVLPSLEGIGQAMAERHFGGRSKHKRLRKKAEEWEYRHREMIESKNRDDGRPLPSKTIVPR